MADTAQRVRRRLDEVFDEAIEREAVTLNPVAMLRTKLRRENRPKRPVPRPALPFGAVPQFVGQLRGKPGIAARCLEFTILTAARTGESIGAQWREFDLQAALWTVPGDRMKGGEPHLVPLSERAVAILREMQALGTPYVFPSTRKGGPMSNMAMLVLLKRMKYTRHHGARVPCHVQHLGERNGRGPPRRHRGLSGAPGGRQDTRGVQPCAVRGRAPQAARDVGRVSRRARAGEQRDSAGGRKGGVTRG